MTKVATFKLMAILTLCLTFVSCADTPSTAGAFSVTVTSSDVTTGTQIAAAFVGAGCGGADTSPQLSWTGNIPVAVRSFAVTATDLNNGNFVHWMIYNIPTSVATLAQAAATPDGATLAINGNGAAAYAGPCPPSGVTRAFAYTVWGLRTANLNNEPGVDFSTAASIFAAIRQRAEVSGALTPIYTGP